jgi:hypothetical protein
MTREVEKRGGGGLRAVGVVGVLVAFWALSVVAGFVWGVVKLVVVVGVLLGVLSLLLGRRK